MSASKSKSKKATAVENSEKQKKSFDSDVLFQKIFDKWYAFSIVDGECLMTEVPEDRIPHYRQNVK